MTPFLKLLVRLRPSLTVLALLGSFVILGNSFSSHPPHVLFVVCASVSLVFNATSMVRYGRLHRPSDE